jgi:hypothetical protein
MQQAMESRDGKAIAALICRVQSQCRFYLKVYGQYGIIGSAIPGDLIKILSKVVIKHFTTKFFITYFMQFRTYFMQYFSTEL